MNTQRKLLPALACLTVMSFQCAHRQHQPNQEQLALLREKVRMNAPKQLRGAPVASYMTSYASPLKNSRVAASPRRYVMLQSVPLGFDQNAMLQRLPPGLEQIEGYTLTPRFLFVPPDAEHMIVDWGTWVDLRNGNGLFFFAHEKDSNYDLSVTNDAFYIYGNEGLWTGEDGPAEKPTIDYTPEGSLLAFRFDEHRRVIVVQNSPMRYPQVPSDTDWMVEVYGDRYAEPDRSYAEHLFSDYAPGKAAAAISDDWIIVVAQYPFSWLSRFYPPLPGPPEDPALRILASEGDSEEHPIELVKTNLRYTPRYLSIVEPYAMIVSDEGKGSRLHCVDISGKEQWSVVVPFAVRQPPIDGSNGRVYLAGDGLAAIESGQVAWLTESTETVRATAFVDGTLAITQGNYLRIIHPDGSEGDKLAAGEDEQLTTPPAITHDGTIWLASEKSLYVTK